MHLENHIWIFPSYAVFQECSTLIIKSSNVEEKNLTSSVFTQKWAWFGVA